MSTRPDLAQAFAIEPQASAAADADVSALDAFLAGVRRRVRARDVAYAALASGGLIVVGVLVAWALRVAPIAGLVGAIVVAGIGLAAWLLARAARWQEAALLPLVESRQPAFRNRLVTARELIVHPTRAKPIIRQRVLRDAATIARDTPLDVIVSPRDTRRAIAAACVVLIGAALLTYGIARWQDAHARTAGGAIANDGTGGPTGAATPAAAAVIRAVNVVITPPTYTGRPAMTLRDPSQISAIAGSHLRLDIDGTASVDGAVVRFNDRPQTLTPIAAHQFRGEMTLADTGVLAVSVTGSTDAPRLIAVTVVPDTAPAVELVTPGRDLLFDDASARVEFVARAQDDLGLRTLALRFTKVSGSGEQYEFHEGELPLALDRRDGRQWQGRLARGLRELELSPGDLFVYYAVATDARPDAAAGRTVSDSYVIEIGKPGTAIAGGFAIPPDEDRFAISLNALIQKTEKLHAKRSTTPAPEFSDAALALAVEQRMVRTEFVFTMGFHGHVDDEEVEAEHSNEIQEGRMENRGQAEMLQATRLMTLSERHLTAADTGEALKAQRGALAAVQRALSRHRYFLRTLPTAGEIDLTRRLTGDLSAASSARWPATDRQPDTRVARARAVLADVAQLARTLEYLVGDGPWRTSDAVVKNRGDLTALANTTATRVLSLDPASVSMQEASAALTQAAAHIAAGRTRDALSRVRKAADAVLPLAQPPGNAASRDTQSAPTDPALRGAVVDALRQRGGPR